MIYSLKKLRPRITTIIFSVILITQSYSCKKFLEKKSDDRLVVPSTVEDLQALLDRSYDMNNSDILGEAYADDYFIYPTYWNTAGTEWWETHLYKYAYLSTDYDYPNDWSKAYNVIYNANLCIERIETITKTNQNKQSWNNVKGSALFFRSYNFLNLAWNYAKAYDETTYQTDQGIVLRLGSDFNKPSTRSTVKETYERIIKDANESALYLPDDPQHVMRPSKAAAYGLLARAYLSMRQYDSAGKYADLCLQLKSDLLDYNNDINVNDDLPFPKFNKETIFFTQFIPLHTLSYSNANVDTVLYAGYSNNDLRKSAMFSSLRGYQIFKGSYAQSFIMFSGIATDEIFLIRAECYARSGNTIAALHDLNALLRKRYDPSFTPMIAASSQEALDIIIIERRKELLSRGLRLMDIKRLNKEGANIVPTHIINGQTYTLAPNDSKYALPIPQAIIDETNIQQN